MMKPSTTEVLLHVPALGPIRTWLGLSRGERPTEPNCIERPAAGRAFDAVAHVSSQVPGRMFLIVARSADMPLLEPIAGNGSARKGCEQRAHWGNSPRSVTCLCSANRSGRMVRLIARRVADCPQETERHESSERVHVHRLESGAARRRADPFSPHSEYQRAQGARCRRGGGARL